MLCGVWKFVASCRTHRGASFLLCGRRMRRNEEGNEYGNSLLVTRRMDSPVSTVRYTITFAFVISTIWRCVAPCACEVCDVTTSGAAENCRHLHESTRLSQCDRLHLEGLSADALGSSSEDARTSGHSRHHRHNPQSQCIRLLGALGPASISQHETKISIGLVISQPQMLTLVSGSPGNLTTRFHSLVVPLPVGARTRLQM